MDVRSRGEVISSEKITLWIHGLVLIEEAVRKKRDKFGMERTITVAKGCCCSSNLKTRRVPQFVLRLVGC
jgi:hypothetical protein